jgi:hypothetical protein
MTVKYYVLRLNSGTPSKPAKFTVLRVWYLFARTSFLEKRFWAKFLEMHKFKIFLLKSVGCLVAWPPMLTLDPKILGSILKQLKKENTNFNILPGIRYVIFEITNKTPQWTKLDVANFDRSQRPKFRWAETGKNKRTSGEK